MGRIKDSMTVTTDLLFTGYDETFSSPSIRKSKAYDCCVSFPNPTTASRCVSVLTLEKIVSSDALEAL